MDVVEIRHLVGVLLKHCPSTRHITRLTNRLVGSQVPSSRRYLHSRQNKIHQLCRLVSTKPGTVLQPDNAGGDVVKKLDDKSYFKRLGKTTNHYWTDHAEDILQRLNMERLVDPDHNLNLRENLRRRYCDDKVDLDVIRSLWGRWSTTTSRKDREELASTVVGLALWVPNDSCSEALAIPDDAPVPINVHGQPTTPEVLEFQKVMVCILYMCIYIWF